MQRAFFSLLLAISTSVFCCSQDNGTAPPASEKAPPPVSAAPEPAAAPPTGQKQNAIVLKEGTEVKLKFAQSVTSRVARPGQMIEFAVAEPVIVDGMTLIDKGARSIGYVAGSSSAGGVGKGGVMEIRMEAIRSHGRMVKIRGEDSRSEKRATGRVVGMTILFGLSGFLLAGGHEVKIPEGTPVTAQVAEDVEFPAK